MYNRKAEEAEEEEDFLDELMREGTAKDPRFPEMVEAQLRKRQQLRALAAKRVELGLARAEVAKRMGIRAYTLESLERGESDPKLSTLEHYALALGQTLELHFVSGSEEGADGKPGRTS
ncbi:MAG TPA: helix-turn-helix transcriptional regulator [Ktedonobacterales bacterium]|jgi:DNA-binding XRE family transcriptional regulator